MNWKDSILSNRMIKNQFMNIRLHQITQTIENFYGKNISKALKVINGKNILLSIPMNYTIPTFINSFASQHEIS